MSLGLLHELSSLCSEICSEKVTNRNKAAERLDNILTNSKTELIILNKRNKNNSVDVSWTDIFNSAIQASLKHASKVMESLDSKNIQAMRNKNHVFSGIVMKLIDYSLEDRYDSITTSTLLTAFYDGFSSRSALKCFGTLFLYVLETGVYKTPDKISELKVNEFSRILSYLFETNIENDENLRFTVMRATTKTIEFSQRFVQLNSDLINYLPEVKAYAGKAADERQKAEVIKLFYLFVSELSIDYHKSVCLCVQEVLPILCGFYNFRMKTEVKETFFRSVVLSLTAIYPHIPNKHCNTINVTIGGDWNKTVKKLETVMDIEIKERRTQLHRSPDASFERCLQVFIEMSAFIVYLIHWQDKSNNEVCEDVMNPRTKMQKIADPIEVILESIQTLDSSFNEIWFAILTELLNTQEFLININNYQQILQKTFQILCVVKNAKNLKNLRICIIALLRSEKRLIQTNNIPENYYSDIWTKTVELLLGQSTNDSAVIMENQLILQALIQNNKLSLSDVSALLQAILVNKAMRREECITTVRKILKYANNYGLDKTSEIVSSVIKWICETNGKIDAKTILLNIEPIDVDLIVDTCAIAVINFFNQNQRNTASKENSQNACNLLLYKYNQKFVCIEEYGEEMRQKNNINRKEIAEDIKYCLFQNNYELLMRLLNFETSKEASTSDILLDLSHMYTMVCLMKRFFEYNIFTIDNSSQCPLIKRIGFFLSHLEFQLKSNDPKSFDRTDLLDILHRIEMCFLTFASNPNLKNYLEAQPLEELILFLGKTLKFSVSRQTNSEFEDWNSLACLCLRILATLSATTTHFKDAFKHIANHNLTMKTDLNILMDLIKIFVSHEHVENVVGVWFVDKLKTVCLLYHNNIEISARMVELLPAIFHYVQRQDEALQIMNIILSSLLKKSYKKSYSNIFVVKLLQCVRLIIKNCDILLVQSDFRKICKSIAKFISCPSLEVQYAAINTITALMDCNWLDAAAAPSEGHAEFCEDLLSQIDLKSFPETTPDENINSTSVTIQLLVALFMFSSYHQNYALRELAYLTALKKLNERDFLNFQQIADYFNCTLAELTNSYVPNLIHEWNEKHYPCSKLPYFLCAEAKEKFEIRHLSVITTCILMHSNVDQLRKFEKYKSKAELVEMALPTLLALTIPYQAGCFQSDCSDYDSYFKCLKNNLKLLSVDLFNHSGSLKIDWRTLYNITELLSDNRHFQNIFGFIPCSQPKKWYNMEFESLLRCLHLYLTSCGVMLEKDSRLLLSQLISKDSSILVRVFSALKTRKSNSIFLIDKLKSFHMYCTFAKLVINSIESGSINNPSAQSNSKYFLRDIIYYILYIVQESLSLPKLQYASLKFVQQVLSSPVVSVGFCSDILKFHLNYIIKTLITSAEKSLCSEVRELSTNVIHATIEQNMEQLSEVIGLLDEFPKSTNFEKLREMHLPTSSEEERDLETIIDSFLETHNKGTECLIATRYYISKNKDQLKLKHNQMNIFIKRLLEIVRNTKNNTFSQEAAKCLGEIGSLKLSGVSYYFETDASFYDSEADLQDPMKYFAKCLLKVLEKILLSYNKFTDAIICNVCEQLVNSIVGINLLDSQSYMNVFRVSSNQRNYLDTCGFTEPIDVLLVLKSIPPHPYEQWICIFVSKLYAVLGWSDFEKLCCCDITFAETSVIPLFKLLVSKSELHLSSVLSMLEFFFTEAFNAINAEVPNNASIYREKRLIHHFLNICECVRIYNTWSVPNINLLYVAKVCNYCQAYFLSIMYLEMWCLYEKNTTPEITNNEIVTNELFQEVSIKAYQSIGCCDAISGFLNPLKSRLEFLSFEGSWSDVLLQADATGMTGDSLYVDNLKKNGLYSLSNVNLKNKSIDYESCWRLCQWDTIVEGHSKVNTLNDMENEYQKHHFNALKCIYNREEINSLAAIANARRCVVLILKEISVECLQSVYKYLTWLHLLQQVEDFCQVQFTSSNDVKNVFDKWKIESNLDYGHFFFKEQVLSHQVTLFRTAGIRANRKIKEYYKENDPVGICLLKCIENCKNAGEINLAIRNIATLRSIQFSNEHVQASVLIEDAKVCLKTGKSVITKSILEHIIKNKDFAFCLQRVEAYRMLGEYLMESKTETFETVMRSYFKASINLLKQFDKNKDKVLLKSSECDQESFVEFERKNRKFVYEAMARYADREYTQLNVYTNSDEFQIKCKIILENRQAADSIGRQNKDKDKNIGAIFLKKNANLDEKEVLSVKQKCTDYLCIAVESYIKFCIIDSSITSPAIYRIIALWFANKQNEAMHSKISKDVGEIPSFKFLCALNQMTARLNSKNKDFLLLLRDILVRCAQDHPHHTLYQLFPLVYAFSDSSNSTSNDRVSIAKDIINKAKNKTNSSCIKQLETMFPALIDLANEKLENNSSLNDKLRRMKNLDAIQCPTIELPVSINKIYNITSVIKWDDKVSLVGGINAPKKLECICSDGRKIPQLLKGKDDLRQDAVMQQVFSMINDLLNIEPETNQLKLKIRTYKVVPLSMRSGILEWCENTVPIGIYLTGDGGKGGAHKKYRPNDYPTQKCRTMSMQHLKSDAEKRLQMFLHICENIKPVFHYFFFEKFLVPGEWFERRLAYVNSVATTSIVGFVLGLGDRHTQNILIDQKTAEVIHIDFGIAFEQGKVMPTPETVPFRLTRDMIAPMGVCETNGVFKKSCEATMRILRRNQAVITTILEVLLYDPLYIWKVVPKVSDDACEEKNLTAQRALFCVQNKLEGKQAGIFGTSDVDVQVQRLINDAILSQNLCLLYPGWDPYL